MESQVKLTEIGNVSGERGREQTRNAVRSSSSFNDLRVTYTQSKNWNLIDSLFSVASPRPGLKDPRVPIPLRVPCTHPHMPPCRSFLTPLQT